MKYIQEALEKRRQMQPETERMANIRRNALTLYAETGIVLKQQGLRWVPAEVARPPWVQMKSDNQTPWTLGQHEKIETGIWDLPENSILPIHLAFLFDGYLADIPTGRILTSAPLTDVFEEIFGHLPSGPAVSAYR